jgi:hypothetical protein
MAGWVSGRLAPRVFSAHGGDLANEPVFGRAGWSLFMPRRFSAIHLMIA